MSSCGFFLAAIGHNTPSPPARFLMLKLYMNHGKREVGCVGVVGINQPIETAELLRKSNLRDVILCFVDVGCLDDLVVLSDFGDLCDFSVFRGGRPG